MEEKDKDIERLFDEYADDLRPRADLAQRARQQMQPRRERAHAKRVAAISIASLAGAAASIAVAVLSVNALFRASGRPGENSPASPPAVYATEYNISDVRAVSISRKTAEEYFDFSAIERNCDIFDENYYACYLKDGGELVYIRGSFGMATESGTTQVGIIAEKAGYRRTDLIQNFKNIITTDDSPVVAKNYLDGEYISQTYWGTATTHYYVTTTGNDQAAYSVVADILR